MRISNDRLNIYLSLASVIVTLSGVLVAWYQLSAMKEQFQSDQRPYVDTHVVPFLPEANTKARADLYWGNYGKSPAFRVTGSGAIFLGNDAIQQGYAWFDQQNPNKDVPASYGKTIPPGVLPEQGKGIFTTLLSDRTVSPSDLDVLVKTDGSISVVMRLVYYDGMGNRYWTDSCYSYLATKAIVNCPKHNEMH